MIEKEELLKEFGERLGKTNDAGDFEKSGISQRTLDAYVGAIAKGGIETADDDFYATHISMLETIGGQIRHEVAERVKSAQSKVSDPEPQEQTPSVDETKIESLQKQLSELMAKINAKDEAEIKNAKLRDIEIAMKEKGAVDEYVLKQVLKNNAIDYDKNADDIAESLLPLYDSEMKECRGKGERPRQGGNAWANNETAASRYFAAKRKREGWN